MQGITYNVTGTIGEGSCGSVFVVEDAKNPALKYALKHIYYKGRHGVKEMVEQEVDIQQKFAGEPTIIQVYGYRYSALHSGMTNHAST